MRASLRSSCTLLYFEPSPQNADSRFQLEERPFERTNRLTQGVYEILAEEISNLPLRQIHEIHDPHFSQLVEKIGYLKAKELESLLEKPESDEKRISAFETPFIWISHYAPNLLPLLAIEAGGEVFVQGLLDRIYARVSAEIQLLRIMPREYKLRFPICNALALQKSWRNYKAEVLVRLSGVIGYFNTAKLFQGTPSELQPETVEILMAFRGSLKSRYRRIQKMPLDNLSAAQTQCRLAEQSIKKYMGRMLEYQKTKQAN